MAVSLCMRRDMQQMMILMAEPNQRLVEVSSVLLVEKLHLINVKI